MKKKQVSIDVISDIICPWCYIGKSRLTRAIEQVADKVEVTTRFRPFQLYPHVPKGGLPKSAFAATKKPGLGSALKEAAMEEGLTFNYKDIERIPNTLEAHRLMYFCEDAIQQNALGMALFESYFEKAEDVESPEILANLAKKIGLKHENINKFLHSDDGASIVTAEIQALKEEGISAVPSFLINGQHLVTGLQPLRNWVRFFGRL